MLGHWMEYSAMLGPLFPLHSLFLHPVRGQKEKRPQSNSDWGWNGHRGRRQCRDDTSCELFHIWAIINHGLRLGKRPQGGRPCGAGAVTCLLTDERSDPPHLPPVATEPMRMCCLHRAGKISATRIVDGAQNILVTGEGGK